MTQQGGNGILQGYLAIPACVFGISFPPLFYKLGCLTGTRALRLNVSRLPFTVLMTLPIAFFSPGNRRAILQTSKRAFWTRWRARCLRSN
jgi:hypothetical protein